MSISAASWMCEFMSLHKPPPHQRRRPPPNLIGGTRLCFTGIRSSRWHVGTTRNIGYGDTRTPAPTSRWILWTMLQQGFQKSRFQPIPISTVGWSLLTDPMEVSTTVQCRVDGMAVTRMPTLCCVLSRVVVDLDNAVGPRILYSQFSKSYPVRKGIYKGAQDLGSDCGALTPIPVDFGGTGCKCYCVC